MKPKDYTVRYYGHIESLDYREGYCQLWIQCNGCGIPRVYCADTVKLPFPRRERVIENLCDYYESATNRVIVVVDEDDEDRKGLECLIARLAAEGQRLTIEYETAERREQFEKGWQLRWLNAGKKLKIEGTELSTVEEYLRWKEAQGAGPKGGATAPDDPGSTVPPPSETER